MKRMATVLAALGTAVIFQAATQAVLAGLSKSPPWAAGMEGFVSWTGPWCLSIPTAPACFTIPDLPSPGARSQIGQN